MEDISELKVDWEEQKCKLRRKIAILTNNNMMFGDSKKEEVFGELQIKYGKTKEQLLDIIIEH